MAKKVQVHFSDEVLQRLEELRVASGETSHAGVLRSAMGLYSWAFDQLESGYKIGAFKDGRPVKEAVLVSYTGKPKASKTDSMEAQATPPLVAGASGRR